MRQGEGYTAGNRGSGSPRTVGAPSLAPRQPNTIVRPKPAIGIGTSDRRRTPTVAVHETRSKKRSLWLWLVAAAGMLALGLCIVCWPLAQNPPPPPISLAPVEKLPGREMPRDPDDALTVALDRLDSALSAAPGSNPQAALRKASTAHKGCMIIWTNGLPSLLFGQEPVRPNSLARILEDCAEAVSSTH